MPSPQKEPWPEDAPITEDEMNQCVEMLQRLHKADRRFKFFDGQCARPLRKAFGPYSRHQQDAMFGGEGRSEYEQKKQVWVQAKGKKAQEKALDESHREKTAMRAKRIEKLHVLHMQDGEQQAALPFVPDGFVEVLLP